MREQPEKRLCRTCGEDITQHARYTRWTECEFCYWKRRLDQSEPLETLLQQRSDLKHKRQEVLDILGRTLGALEKHRARLQAHASWWKKVFGDIIDNRCHELDSRVFELQQKCSQIENLHKGIEISIKAFRHARNRFNSAAKHRAYSRKRAKEIQERKQEFDELSCESANSIYDRYLFTIRKKDYKRGNPIDNHFRNGILAETLAAFDNKCLFCGSRYDLTLDHFAIPKNEGGNFTLLLEKERSIKMNVVVLCRSCNAAKGEMNYLEFFDESKIIEAISQQKRLLEFVLQNKSTMQIIKDWYRIRML